MADFILFNAGANYLLDNGFPATCWFGISTNSVDATSPWVATAVLTSPAETTGTGYTRKSQAEPAASSRTKTFAQMTWTTGAATNWTATARSVFLATTNDSTGTMICAWNLQVGGAARDLSAASTTENFTPTFAI